MNTDQPITPGEGWRLLAENEVLQHGDEIWQRGVGPWSRVQASSVGCRWQTSATWRSGWFPARRRIEQSAPVAPAVETELKPCPFCGQTPILRDDYDRYSGYGQTTKGWVECGCGASIFKPTPTDPYPKRVKSDAIAAWNFRS